VTGEELLDAFRSFTHEAVRLETLQYYDVPGDEDRQRAFREGRPLPSRPEKSTSVQIIQDATAAGKRFERIHVVDKPLSDYVRYEIEAAYPENAAAGERILIVDRAADPRLDLLREDFVLLDGDTNHPSVIWYRYTDAGEITSWDAGTSADVRACHDALELARTHAVPLSEFLTTATSKDC
jgi:hypothetical protein